MGRLTENTILVLKNKCHSVTAEVLVTNVSAEGVIIAQGGTFGGWSLYAQEAGPPIATTSSCAAIQGRC